MMFKNDTIISRAYLFEDRFFYVFASLAYSYSVSCDLIPSFL